MKLRDQLLIALAGFVNGLAFGAAFMLFWALTTHRITLR